MIYIPYDIIYDTACVWMFGFADKLPYNQKSTSEKPQMLNNPAACLWCNWEQLYSCCSILHAVNVRHVPVRKQPIWLGLSYQKNLLVHDWGVLFQFGFHTIHSAALTLTTFSWHLRWRLGWRIDLDRNTQQRMSHGSWVAFCIHNRMRYRGRPPTSLKTARGCSPVS